MKYLGILSLLPLSAFAVKIPADYFDQTKLESLLRRIPQAKVKSEDMTNFTRNFYEFPQVESSFVISCTADHYRSSPIPSNSECTLDVVGGEKKGDEILLKITNAEVVGNLYKAMPVTSAEVRKLYSTERVYGTTAAGAYREIFRYMFACSEKECSMSFTTKPAKE